MQSINWKHLAVFGVVAVVAVIVWKRYGNRAVTVVKGVV